MRTISRVSEFTAQQSAASKHSAAQEHMTVATRTLKLRWDGANRDVCVRIFAPEQQAPCEWSCTYEIDWPEGMRKCAAHGADSVQALLLALKMIGSEIYASDYHKSGALSSADSWQGYGFPVPPSLRGLLIGDDAKYL